MLFNRNIYKGVKKNCGMCKKEYDQHDCFEVYDKHFDVLEESTNFLLFCPACLEKSAMKARSNKPSHGHL